MKKFSTNYCNTIGNFVVGALPMPKQDDNSKYYDTICVLKNILTRGSLVTPSKFLCQKYNYELANDNIQHTFLSGASFAWLNTIKGGNKSNPALKFYQDFASNFSDYSFVKELIIPEAYITDIIGESLEDIVEERVDFYIPQAKLVIEIDGPQHQQSQEHDQKRDQILQKYGNKVIRIKTQDIYDHNSSYLKQINFIKSEFGNSELILKYKKNNSLPANKENLTIIYRLEIIILELLLSNNITLDDEFWNIKINADESLLIDAYTDLKEWFSHLLALRNISLEFPKLNINGDTPIYIDINIYERYSDSTFSRENTIICRTDYFDNANYFKMASGNDINYNLKRNKEDHLKWLLNNIFGFSDFKEGQLPIIKNLLNLKHTIGVLPTGSGKSLCYQFASLLEPSTSIIVCPLTSLIKDQCDSMKRRNINNVRTIDSTLSREEKNQVLKDIGEGKSLFNWIAPERFQIKSFRKEIQKLASSFNITYVVIDEVHCLSEWGHDFRISYLQLVSVVKKFMPNCVLVGLTATLSATVLSDIKKEFGLADTDFENIISKKKFSRDELHFIIHNILEKDKEKVFDETTKKYFPTYLPSEKNQASLIFTPFKKGSRGCTALCYKLQNKYHDYKHNIDYFAGADSKEEQRHNITVQEKFINNTISLLCATKAFGMGIDKPNIRLTIHYGMSSSIDSFYQEVGRAARDGQDAVNIVLHSKDHYKLKELVKRPDFDIEVCDYYGRGDLGDQVTLFSKGLNNSHNESLAIYRFFNYIKSLVINNEFVFNITFADIFKITNNNKPIEKFFCENILYKLYILGVIKDWTIDFAKNEFEIIITEINPSNMLSNLNKYIQKSESSFDINNLDLSKYQKYYDILYQSDISLEEKCIKILCEWYYEKITYRKVLEICNLDEVLNTYNTDEALKKYINEYYTLDDDNVTFSLILQNPKDYTTILDLFKENNIFISKEKCEKLAILIDRFLIETKYNDALNLLDSLLALCLAKDSDLNNIKVAINEIDDEGLINKLIDLGQIMPKSSQTKYFDTLKSKYNSFKYLNSMYQISKDQKTYLEIMQNFNIRIKEIERKF